MRPSPRAGLRTALLALLGALAAAGCAARRPPATPPPGPPPAEAAETAGEAGETGDAAAATTEEPAREAAEEAAAAPRLRDLCRERQADQSEPFLEEARRRLEVTFCSATLWFDGLFGGDPDVQSAREVWGWVELSSLYTEFEGFDPKGRLHIEYDLPTLERRLNLFLGRDVEDEFVEDRPEGAAIRSAVFGLETEEEWLAGLGYSPPGRWAQRLDFRLGGRIKTAPEFFVQGRWRRNVFVGDRTVWRLRETLFWENREGYGSTSSLDLDRVLRPDLLFRAGGVGTFSESTDGLAWRLAVLLYHHLVASRALAGEMFWRGSTAAPVEIREIGARAIYRQPIGKPYLIGNFIVGYTWPRKEVDEPREGSAMLGFGVELHFGRERYGG